jgi:hypothetical protein
MRIFPKCTPKPHHWLLFLALGCLLTACVASAAHQPDNSPHVFVCAAALQDSAKCGYENCRIFWVPGRLIGNVACRDLLGRPVANALVTTQLLIPLEAPIPQPRKVFP